MGKQKLVGMAHTKGGNRKSNCIMRRVLSYYYCIDQFAVNAADVVTLQEPVIKLQSNKETMSRLQILQ